jgi:hypothetical protein
MDNNNSSRDARVLADQHLARGIIRHDEPDAPLAKAQTEAILTILKGRLRASKAVLKAQEALAIALVAEAEVLDRTNPFIARYRARLIRELREDPETLAAFGLTPSEGSLVFVIDGRDHTADEAAALVTGPEGLDDG